MVGQSLERKFRTKALKRKYRAVWDRVKAAVRRFPHVQWGPADLSEEGGRLVVTLRLKNDGVMRRSSWLRAQKKIIETICADESLKNIKVRLVRKADKRRKP